MLTRGPDVAFQKNTFLSLASVCLSCQDPLFCFQLSLTAPLLPLPHLKWPPQWLALVLEQKEGKALRICLIPQQAGENVSNAIHCHMSTPFHIQVISAGNIV